MYLDYICPFLPQKTGTLLKVREFIYDYARTIGTMTVALLQQIMEGTDFIGMSDRVWDDTQLPWHHLVNRGDALSLPLGCKFLGAELCSVHALI
jgi:hypothetical protein